MSIMKRAAYVVGAVAACLIAVPVLAANTGVTIQIPAATVVTSLDAASVTLLDAAGLYLATDVEAALASVRTRPVFAAAQADVPTYAACTPATDLQWYYVTDASPDATLAGAIVVCAVGANQWRPLFAPWAHASRHLVGESDAVIADQLETDCADGELLVGETDVNADTGQSVGCLAPSYAASGAVTSSGLTLATGRLLGRTTASTGAVEEITPDSTLSLVAGGLGVVDVACTGCIGSTEVAGLDAADLTSGTIGVARGGTGATSLTAYEPVCGGTTSTGAVQSCGTGQSNSGYVWTSNGASALPSWQAAAGGVSDPLTIGTLITTTSLQPRGGGSYPEDQVQVGPGASASSSIDNYGATASGRNATASDAGAVCEGDSCSAGLWGACYGYAAQCPDDPNGAAGYGKQANVAGTGACFGGGCAATGAGSGAFAQLARATYDFSLALGWSARDTEANQLVIGGPGPILNAYIGKGVTSASPPTNLTMHATDGEGSDVAATNYRIAGGAATGNATGGAIVLMTSDAGASSSTLQTLTEKFRVPTLGGYSSTPLASPPYPCDAGHEGYEYSDTSHAKCWCDGTTWTKLAGAGTCA